MYLQKCVFIQMIFISNVFTDFYSANFESKGNRQSVIRDAKNPQAGPGRRSGSPRELERDKPHHSGALRNNSMMNFADSLQFLGIFR